MNKLTLTILSLPFLSACSPSVPDVPGFFGLSLPTFYKNDIHQGSVLSRFKINQLKLDMSPAQVQALIGSPSIIDPFHNNQWDYLNHSVLHQKDDIYYHLILTFNDDKLTNIDTSGISSLPALTEKEKELEVERTAEEKLAVEKALAAEKKRIAEEKLAAEQAIAAEEKRIAEEKAAAEKAARQTALKAKKIAEEKLAAEKAMAKEKLAAEKAATEKAAQQAALQAEKIAKEAFAAKLARIKQREADQQKARQKKVIQKKETSKDKPWYQLW